MATARAQRARVAVCTARIDSWRFDMDRTAHDNAGLVAYKRTWGAQEEPLPYYYHPQVAGLASTSEESWKYRLLTTCWRRLPLPVSEALGGALYQHLG